MPVVKFLLDHLVKPLLQALLEFEADNNLSRSDIGELFLFLLFRLANKSVYACYCTVYVPVCFLCD